MKLIDILVRELPKRGGWPDGAKTVAQDSCGECWGFDCCNPKIKNGLWWVSDSGTDLIPSSKVQFDLLADDWSSTFITREQYEASLAAKNEGWIEWGGGECPVPCGTMVDVKHRCGAASENQQAWPKGHKESDVIVNPLSNAGQAFWRHENSVMDIIAYRLHKTQEEEQAKADDESDLNECIGQGAAPVWNGEGLPPVGCECEWQDKNTKQWQPVKVVYASEWVTVIREINKEKGDDLVEIAIENYGDDARLKFRPIRSESELKREEAVKAITLTGWCQTAAEEIYDLIAAGKVPGMKLED